MEDAIHENPDAIPDIKTYLSRQVLALNRSPITRQWFPSFDRAALEPQPGGYAAGITLRGDPVEIDGCRRAHGRWALWPIDAIHFIKSSTYLVLPVY